MHPHKLKKTSFLLSLLALLIVFPTITKAGPGPQDVIKAIKAQNIPQLKKMLDTGIPVDFKVEGDWTPLHFAAETGNAQIGKMFLELGANVNAESLGGEIPLHRAVMKGSLPFVKLLIAYKTKTNVANEGDHTPLDWVLSAIKTSKDKAKIKNWKAIATLLKANAN